MTCGGRSVAESITSWRVIGFPATVATTSFGSAGVGAGAGAPFAAGAGAAPAGAGSPATGAFASGAGAGVVVSVLVVSWAAPGPVLRMNPVVETRATAPASRAARNDTWGISRDLSWFRGSWVRSVLNSPLGPG